MSTDHCRHGRITADHFGGYRCYECEPLTEEERRDLNYKAAHLAELVHLLIADRVKYIDGNGVQQTLRCAATGEDGHARECPLSDDYDWEA